MVRFSGKLYKVNFERVTNIFATVFETHNLVVRHRLFGEELHLCNDEFNFHLYSSLDRKWNNDQEDFMFDFFYQGNIEDVLSIANRLSDKLINEGVIFFGACSEIDENGNEIGEEKTYAHPDLNIFIRDHLCTPLA